MYIRRYRPSARGFDISLALVALALVAASMVRTERRPTPAPSPIQLSGTLVVADLRGHALVVRDLTRSTSRRIRLAGGPHELLALPDGRVAASLEQAGTVAFVDLTGDAVEYLAMGGLPHGLLLEGNELLVTDRAAHAVRRFTLGGWQELEPIATGALPHQIASTGRSLLVADASSSEFRFGPERVAWQPAVTESLALSPDAAHVAYAGARDGLVRILDVESGEAVDVPLEGRPVRLAFAPDGASVAVALSAVGQIALVDLAGTVRRVDVGGVPDGLAFAGESTLFTSDIAGGPVSWIDISSGQVVGRLDGGTTPGALLFVPAPR